MKQKELMNYHHHRPRRTVSMLLPTPVAFATPWWIVMQPTVDSNVPGRGRGMHWKLYNQLKKLHG
jgi:hypothetical protein